jgi:hypothetical protein
LIFGERQTWRLAPVVAAHEFRIVFLAIVSCGACDVPSHWVFDPPGGSESVLETIPEHGRKVLSFTPGLFHMFALHGFYQRMS